MLGIKGEDRYCLLAQLVAQLQAPHQHLVLIIFKKNEIFNIYITDVFYSVLLINIRRKIIRKGQSHEISRGFFILVIDSRMPLSFTTGELY
jgi:hypothetical protein